MKNKDRKRMYIGEVELLEADKESRFDCHIKCQSFIQPISREDLENLQTVINMWLGERCCEGGYLNEVHTHKKKYCRHKWSKLGICQKCYKRNLKIYE